MSKHVKTCAPEYLNKLIERHVRSHGAKLHAVYFGFDDDGEFQGLRIVTDKKIPPFPHAEESEINEEISEESYQKYIATAQRENIEQHELH